jgi:hypothetical protein
MCHFVTIKVISNLFEGFDNSIDGIRKLYDVFPLDIAWPSFKELRHDEVK